MGDRHYEQIAVAVILSVLFLAILRQCWVAEPTEEKSHATVSETMTDNRLFKGGNPNDPETLYRYILHVIRHGSNRLGFPGGVMEGGYLPEDEAPKVACYVMELNGHRCPRPYPKDAAMFYTSVCGGCHGDDGRGLHGAYPDLTRSPLLGLQKILQEKSR